MLLRPTSLALAAVLALGAPAALAAPVSDRTPDRTVELDRSPKPAAPLVASQADTAGYAQREQRDAHQVANYQGGSTVVVLGVSGGTLLVILLVLLILL